MLGATIAMLLALGDVACCTTTAAGYQKEHALFVDLLLDKDGGEKKKGR